MDISQFLNQLTQENLIKYLVMFVVVSVSSFIIPTCGVLKQHAIYVGFIASTTYSILDMCFPNYILPNKPQEPSMY